MDAALLEEIKLAYHSEKLKPIRRLFLLHGDQGDCACPLVALALHRSLVDRADPGTGIDSAANLALEAAAKAFGEDWAIGFLDGFDGQKQAKNDPEYVDGFALGQATAQQLFPRDPSV